MKKFLLFSLLAAAISLSAVFSADEPLKKVNIYLRNGDSLAFAECTFTQLYPYPDPGVPCLEIKEGGASRKYLHPLYTIYTTGCDEKGEYKKCIFRINADFFKNSDNPDMVFSLTTKKNGYYSSNYTNLSSINIISDPSAFNAIEKEWKNEFKRFLLEEISLNEDHEMELMLYLKFFGELPADKSSNSWKKESIMKFLFSISGLNDIRDAIPTEKKPNISDEKLTKEPPAPILLPQVASKNVDLDPSFPTLSRYVPRSCYYLEWSSFIRFTEFLDFTAAQFDKWVKGVYPKTFKQLSQHHLNRLGLSKEDLVTLENNTDAIAIAGWDLNFQSGTNLLMVLKTKRSFTLPKSVPFGKTLDGNIHILSTGKKLFDMSLNCFEKGQSLLQVDNFKYSRNKLKCTENLSERLFVYLSDYWLTNFISPRWKIYNDRLATIDAKIRMVHLLKLIQASERNLPALPALSELKKEKILPESWNEWLFDKLTEHNGVTVHEDYGGLFDHKPIDTLSFDKVTDKEHSSYLTFKRMYESRWRQMDPLALSVFYNSKDDLWGSSLYISPISNQSNFRFIRDLACKPKLTHTFDLFSGQAYGLSIAVATKMFGFWLRSVTVPMNLFVQVTGLDFATSSYVSAHWLEEMRNQSPLSFMRLPVAVVLPELLISGLTPMFRWVNRNPSEYEGIDEVMTPIDRSRLFPIYVMSQPESGIAYLGINPNTLSSIRSGMQKEKLQDTKPCDIRAFIDFKYAYMMRRKLLQLAVKNRALSSWQTENRLFRISRLLGFSNDAFKESRFKAGLESGHIFPVEYPASDRLVHNMPALINYKSQSRWDPPIMDEFDKLPELMQKLLRLDFYASVEDNAIFIETDYKIKGWNPRSAKSDEGTQAQRRACVANMRMLEGAFEMWKIDGKMSELDGASGKSGLVTDFDLISGGYIQRFPKCPVTNKSNYTLHMAKNKVIEIECPCHGTIIKALESRETPQEARQENPDNGQTNLDFDDN